MFGFGQIVVTRLAVQLAEFELRATVVGAARLAQQFETNAPVAGVAALAAEQFAQAALCHHYTLSRGLFEQTTGELFGANPLTKARAVQ
jgi:hypothetical protein